MNEEIYSYDSYSGYGIVVDQISDREYECAIYEDFPFRTIHLSRGNLPAALVANAKNLIDSWEDDE